MQRILIIGVIVIFTTLGAVFFLNQNEPQVESLVGSNTALKKVLPTSSPTPFPFEELTIPYLRNREYKSSLGNLEKYAENTNYNSYLTDYDSDSLKIHGLLTKPSEEQPAGGWPAIIFVHGYIPPGSYQTTQNYSDYVDFLARNGFVIFKIDLRGHGDSEGEPGGAYYSSDYIIDTLNAYAALQGADFINSKKIGLLGHSMAGNVVMRSFAAQPKIPAVVIWAGAGYTYTDLAEFGIRDSSYQPPQMTSERIRKRQQIFDIYGRPNKGSEFWKQVAPTTYLNDLKGGISLHHAINDSVVNIEYSRNLDNLLDSTRLVHELHEYQDGGHNFTGASFTEAMQNTVDFFKKSLSI